LLLSWSLTGLHWSPPSPGTGRHPLFFPSGNLRINQSSLFFHVDLIYPPELSRSLSYRMDGLLFFPLVPIRNWTLSPPISPFLYMQNRLYSPPFHCAVRDFFFDGQLIGELNGGLLFPFPNTSWRLSPFRDRSRRPFPLFNSISLFFPSSFWYWKSRRR